jgi:hypothetical protein
MLWLEPREEDEEVDREAEITAKERFREQEARHR